MDDITNQEFNKLATAIRDPKFPALLAEYLHEMADPCNRDELIEYMHTLSERGDLPSGKILVHPTPCFCAETYQADFMHAKVFLNITSSNCIEDGSFNGRTCHIPYFVGPPRYEGDNGTPCIVIDAIVGTSVGQEAIRRGANLMNGICELVIDELNKGQFSKHRISEDIRLRREWAYKDGLRVVPALVSGNQLKRFPVDAGTQECAESERDVPVIVSDDAHILDQDPPEHSRKASFTVMESSCVDGSGFEESGQSESMTKVTVTLPGVVSASAIDFHVFIKSLSLTASTSGSPHSLKISLPRAVQNDPIVARFDKTKSVLTLLFVHL